jgi:hypothetical protein
MNHLCSFSNLDSDDQDQYPMDDMAMYLLYIARLHHNHLHPNIALQVSELYDYTDHGLYPYVIISYHIHMYDSGHAGDRNA